MRDWDTAAIDWSSQLSAGYDRVREEYNWPAFVSMLGPVSGKTIVDLGCGDGDVTRRLAHGGATVIGIDPSEQMIATATALTQSPDIRYAVVPQDAPFEGMAIASADFVVSFMGVMSMRDLKPIAAGAVHVLRPGGRLVMALLHPCFSHSGMAWRKDSDGRILLELSSYATSRDVPGSITFQTAQETHGRSFAVRRQERTLSSVLAPFLSENLRLTRLEEPQPAAEAVEANRHLRRWRYVAPAFLHLEFQK
ncbi:MAG: class I SAM-dependent methyltransferase [Aliishimia sp.]